MKPVLYFIAFQIALATPTFGDPRRVNEHSAANNQAFVENMGQITDQSRNPRKDIDFSLNATKGLNIFFGAGAIYYQFSKEIVANTIVEKSPLISETTNEPKAYDMYRLDVSLAGANRNVKPAVFELQDYYENYYTATASSNGATAHAYNRIVYRNTYPNIDWVLYTNGGKLKHEFVVREGGDAKNIRIVYSGAKELKINSDGSLTVITPQGEIVEDAPITRTTAGNIIESRFVLRDSVLTYQIEATGPFIIDPAIIWATYYGSSPTDAALAITCDRFNNSYTAGNTRSATGIVTTGAHQTVWAGGTYDGDAFLLKCNSAGVRKWATYYGGTDEETGNAVVTDTFGNIYMVGNTGSTSGIATPGAFQTVFGGNRDGFLAKFDSNGVRSWCTYYGNTGNDNARSLTIDPTGNVCFGGSASSSTGIASVAAHQTVYAGSYDGYVAKFSPSGSRIWATYYGASDQDEVISVSADSAGNIYAAGITNGITGLATPGAFLTSSSGGAYEGFLVKFNTSGVRQWATYYGGTDWDVPLSTAIDTSGNAYIAGYTWSDTGIATPGAYDTGLTGTTDAFIAKFSPSGSQIWSTYLGGANSEQVRSLAADNKGNIFAGGYTTSTTELATTGAHQMTSGGMRDAFIAKFNAAGMMQWSTFYGGPDTETGMAVATDRLGFAYFVGQTSSASGISTPTGFQPVAGGGDDGFIARFDTCVLPIPGTLSGPTAICVAGTATLTPTVTGGTWIASNSHATVAGGVLTGITPGVDTISYTVTNTCGTSTIVRVLTINPLPGAIAGATVLCGTGGTATLTCTPAGGTWSAGTGVTIGSATGIVSSTALGTTAITYTLPTGCAATSVLTINPVPTLSSTLTPAPICDSTLFAYVPLSATSGASFAWTRPFVAGIGSLAGSGIGNPNEILKNNTNTTISVTYIYTVSAGGCSSVQNVTVPVQPTPRLSNVLPPVPVCSGTLFSFLPTSLVVGVTYTWSRDFVPGIANPATTGSGSIGETLINTTSAPVTAVYTYVLSVAGCTHVQTIGLVVKPEQDPGIISGPDDVCEGNTITLAATVGGGTWSISGTGATVSGGVVSGITAGVVTVSYSVDCGTSIATKTVTVLPAADCENCVNPHTASGVVLQIVPNPSGGTFVINLFTPTTQKANVLITDVLGRKIYEATTSTNIPIRITAITARGNYVVNVTTESGSYMDKIVVNQ